MPPDSPHPRMSGEDRRHQLIEVAIDLFSQRGFGGTTTREIAAAAGVTEAVIFRHFATKQDLYKAILDHKCDAHSPAEWMATAQTFMDAKDDEGLFRYVLSSIVAGQRKEPRFERLLLHAALEGHELAIMHHNQLMSSVGIKFRQYIVNRQNAGALRQGDPTAIILALVGAAKHYAMQRYLYQRSEIQVTDEQIVEGFVSIFMHGVALAKTPAPKQRKATK